MAKRISSSSVNWKIIEGRLADNKKFFSIKSKLDKYLRQYKKGKFNFRVASQPAELPKIDWSFYKNSITTPGVIEAMKKGYETLTIPYPSDQGYLNKIKKKEEELLSQTAKEDEETLKMIEKLKNDLKVMESQIPFSDMSVEEFMLARPEFKIDPDNPKLWPQFIDTNYPDVVPHRKPKLH